MEFFIKKFIVVVINIVHKNLYVFRIMKMIIFQQIMIIFSFLLDKYLER